MSEQQYPMRKMAKLLEAQGRFGDTQLVHLNPAELEGIAALSPTGQLTINPVTGQPEAFLPLLIPLLASWGGTAAAGALGASAVGAAVAGGLASGVATGALTGDWERGLASGVLGAGLGGALAGAGMAGEAAAGLDQASQLAPEVADMSAAIASGAESGASALPVGAEAADLMTQLNGIPTTTTPGLSSALNNAPVMSMPGNAADMSGALGSAGTEASMAANSVPPPESHWYGDWSEAGRQGFGQRFKENLGAPFQEGSGFGGKLMQQRTLLPMAMGAGALMEADTNDKWARQMDKSQEEKDREVYDLEESIRRGSLMAQPNLNTGINTLKNYGYDFDQWRRGFSDGGIVRMAAGDEVPPVAGASPAALDLAQQVQLGLRGRYKMAPPNWWRPGIDGEFDWFQGGPNDSYATAIANYVAPYRQSESDLLRAYPPFKNLDEWGTVEPDDGPPTPPDSPTGPPNTNPPPTSVPGDADGDGIPDNIDPYDNRQDYDPLGPGPRGGRDRPPTLPFAGGGDVTLNTDLGPQVVAGGGIAQVPTPYTQPQTQPTEQDIQMVAMALMGQAGENSDKIIDTFIRKYGDEVFTQVRNLILQSVEPGAQTEGMIRGQGGGMDDQVMGTIAGQQPVAVSPGEYIVPADVVSGLGDGSSDAGAQELDQMASKVRMARGGTTSQPPPFDAARVLPR